MSVCLPNVDHWPSFHCSGKIDSAVQFRNIANGRYAKAVGVRIL